MKCLMSYPFTAAKSKTENENNCEIFCQTDRGEKTGQEWSRVAAALRQKVPLKKLFPLSHLHAFTGLCQEDVQRVAKENNDGLDHVQFYISDMSHVQLQAVPL